MSCRRAQTSGGRLADANVHAHTHHRGVTRTRLALNAALDSTLCLPTGSESARYRALGACARVCPIHTLRWFPHSPPLIGLSLIQTNWRPDLNGKHYSLLCGTVEDSLTISARNYITALPGSPLVPRPPPRSRRQGRGLTDSRVLMAATKYPRVCKIRHASADVCVLFAMQDKNLAASVHTNTHTDTHKVPSRRHWLKIEYFIFWCARCELEVGRKIDTLKYRDI